MKSRTERKKISGKPADATIQVARAETSSSPLFRPRIVGSHVGTVCAVVLVDVVARRVAALCPLFSNASPTTRTATGWNRSSGVDGLSYAYWPSWKQVQPSTSVEKIEDTMSPVCATLASKNRSPEGPFQENFRSIN